MIENPPITYILLDNSDKILVYETWCRLRQDLSHKVEYIVIASRNQFFSEWNSLGENSNGKQFYALDEVVLVFHGGDNYINIPGTDDIYTSDVINPYLPNSDTLERKRIRSLILSSCNNGDLSALTYTNDEIDSESNLATAFISWGTIGEVYAWSGRATYIAGGTVDLGLFDFQFTIERSFEKEGHYVRLLVETITGAIICFVYGDQTGVGCSVWAFIHGAQEIAELDIGRVRYYLSQEGKIAYEKVPDSSWSFTDTRYAS